MENENISRNLFYLSWASHRKAFIINKNKIFSVNWIFVFIIILASPSRMKKNIFNFFLFFVVVIVVFSRVNDGVELTHYNAINSTLSILSKHVHAHRHTYPFFSHPQTWTSIRYSHYLRHEIVFNLHLIVFHTSSSVWSWCKVTRNQ